MIGFNMVKPMINQFQEFHVGWSFLNWWRILYFLPFSCFGLLGLFFGLEPGFRVPDPLVSEVVPPPLAFYRIYAHKGSPYLERKEILRASHRPAPANACKPSLGFSAGIGQPHQASLYRDESLCHVLFEASWKTCLF